MGRPTQPQPMCNTCWHNPAVKLVTVPSGVKRWKCQHCIDASKRKPK